MAGTIDHRGALARAWGGPAGDLLIMLALGLLAAAALAAAPARLYTFDAVSYAWQIEQFARTGERRWLLTPTISSSTVPVTWHGGCCAGSRACRVRWRRCSG